MFDRNAAKAAGYSDQEINQYLAGGSTTPSSPTPNVQSQVAQQMVSAPKPATPSYSVGGFLGNLGSDAVNTVKGIVTGIPSLALKLNPVAMEANNVKDALDLVQGKKPSNDNFNTIKNIGTGLYNEYKGLVTDPVNHIYNAPISSVLDVAPVIGKVGEVANLAKGGKAAQVATDATKAGEVASKVPNVATKMFGNNFAVKPSTAASLRPEETFAEMLQHGVTGTPKQMMSKINQVTGSGGRLPQLVREAVSKIPTEVPVNDVPGMMRTQIESIPGLSNKNIQAYMKDLSDRLKLGTGKSISGIAPMDALDAVQSLQSKAAEYFKKPASDLTQSLGDIYSSAADELRTRLDQAANAADVIAPNADAIAKELSNISPRLGQQFLAKPTVGTLRSLQAPFVRMSKILENTAANGAGGSAKIVRDATNAVMSGAGFAGGGIPGAVGGAVLSPFVSSAVESVMPNITTRLAGGITKAANATLPSISPSAVNMASAAHALTAGPMPTIPQAQADQVGQGTQSNQPPQSDQAMPNVSQGIPADPAMEQIMQIQQAMTQDYNTTGGRRASQLQALLNAAIQAHSTYTQQYGGQVQSQLMDVNRAQNSLNQIHELFLGSSGAANTGLGTGNIQGLAREKLVQLDPNADPSAKNYQDLRETVGLQIASVLNGGSDRLSPESVKLVLDMLPTLRDTKENAQVKLNHINSLLAQNRATIINSTPQSISQQTLPDIPQGGPYGQ